jgi:6-phosphogluconolactonase
MKKLSIIFATFVASTLFVSCHKEIDKERSVYTLSNQVTNNDVLAFNRKANGTLLYQASYSTHGTGTGASLGSQGALTLSRNKQWLFAVNAGSNDISVFKVNEQGGLYFSDKKPSGGITPISVTNYDNLVYVLNTGGSSNISGFYFDANNGSLTPIPLSTRQLPDKLSAPAQVSFTNDGSALAITEKAASKIVSYNVSILGIPFSYHELGSASPTPFGFAVGNNNNIYVTEATQSALSVYHVGSSSINKIDGPVINNQKAACWAVISEDGNYVYTANAGSNTISGYKVSATNHVSLLNANGVTAVTGSGPIEEALGEHSKFLYILNSGSHNISGFSVLSNGSLQALGAFGTLPNGAAGLAAL